MTTTERINEINERIDKATADLTTKQEEIKNLKKEAEKLAVKRNKELAKIVLDAAIIGADNFRVKHGMDAPYSHAYYMTNDVTKKNNHYCQPVTCQRDWAENLPIKMVTYLLDNGWTDADFAKLQADTNAAWAAFPTTYSNDVYAAPLSDWSNHHVANGYETNGFGNIVAGGCHGTYSNCTTTSQNQLSQDLIILKGFCADHEFDSHNNWTNKSISLETVKEVYARHGIDNDFSNVTAWIKRNADRAFNSH